MRYLKHARNYCLHYERNFNVSNVSVAHRAAYKVNPKSTSE